MKMVSGEERLDLTISYILIIGVMASVAVEMIGILAYYHSDQNLSIVFQPDYAMKGSNFFSYTIAALQALFQGSWTPMHILGLGIVLLMITPYMRVAASVIYFTLAKNVKYLMITLFVLIVLTASLLLH
jgi:uncharacterized membrane protein